MITKAHKSLAAALVLGALTGFAQAETITFDPLTSTSMGVAGDGMTYVEGGLTFTSSTALPQALYHWGTSDPYNADPTGATLFQNWPGQDLVVTKTGGGSFDLDSFDLADAFNSGAAGDIGFSYTDGSGTHSLALTLDDKVGLQTFAFGFTGVTSFSLRQEAPYFQLDNVSINAVPEPGTYALMVAGLAAVGFTARRKAGKPQV